jgi:mannose-6-phosphate isomerase
MRVLRRLDHPIPLSPHLAKRVWGGDRLGPGIGEAWDLSVHPNGPARIAGGPLAGRTLSEVAAGSPSAFGGPVRLLAKRLDCARDLSVQVHPRVGDPKTEAWVVLAAEPGAGVYHGFADDVNEAQVRAAALDGTLPELLRFLPLEAGDCVFVPSGTVHGIGGGLFLFELQQSADTTYRLFDWGRDRELHLDRALASADLSGAIPYAHDRRIECEHFFVDPVTTAATLQLDPGASWIAALVTAGAVRVGELRVESGGTVLVPRAAGAHTLEPHGECGAIIYGPSRSSA